MHAHTVLTYYAPGAPLYFLFWRQALTALHTMALTSPSSHKSFQAAGAVDFYHHALPEMTGAVRVRSSWNGVTAKSSFVNKSALSQGQGMQSYAITSVSYKQTGHLLWIFFYPHHEVPLYSVSPF